MKYHLKPLEGCLRLMQIQVEPTQVAERREAVCTEIARSARLPGFRPGKAPRDLVVRQYAAQIEEELLKRLIGESCHQAIQELRLPVVEIREIQDVSFKEERLSFKAKVEVRPEVPLRRYKGIKATRPKVEVRPEEVQQVLRSLQEEHAELLPKEGAVAEGDFVVCDLKRRLNGKEIEERKNFLLSVTKEGESSAKVVEALTGSRPGETRQLTLPLPKKEGSSEELLCEFVIHEVKTKRYPPLEDAFAKQVGNFSTLQELEGAIREGLLKDKEKRAQKELEQKILDQLVKECSFPLPTSLLEREAKREETQFRLRCQLVGMKPEEIEGAFQKEKTACDTRAAHGLRRAFILDRVATLEKLEASQEEIKERLQTLSASSNPEALRGRVEEEIRLEKAMTFLVTHAQLSEG